VESVVGKAGSGRLEVQPLAAHRQNVSTQTNVQKDTHKATTTKKKDKKQVS
jgi:hypothetical protein